MQLSDFSYFLPEKLIASYPVKRRSDSRLLCLDKNIGKISHYQFKELVNVLNPGDLLVFNDTRVIPARLYGNKETGGKLELLVERILDNHTALVHIKSNRSPKIGTKLIFDNNIQAEIVNKDNDLFKITFIENKSILKILEEIGHIPLPPYIKRPDEDTDYARYQTVYAKYDGSVAAPTAGLHFDEELLNILQNKGVLFAYVTLHVGAGTFQPVRVDDIRLHHMHSEWMSIDEANCNKIKEVRNNGGRIIAVGTTSVRCLETIALSGEIKPFAGDTDIFIYPGFKFRCVDAIITNFHLPKSSLLMLISAFAGRERIMNAYEIAIQKKYRFYSYGDAMFIY